VGVDPFRHECEFVFVIERERIPIAMLVVVKEIGRLGPSAIDESRASFCPFLEVRNGILVRILLPAVRRMRGDGRDDDPVFE
jgi:hypothetical protein